MAVDIESAKNFIVAHMCERGTFVPRQDLLIDSKTNEYTTKYLKIHTAVSEQAIDQLIEDKVLIEIVSAEVLEEIIRTGMAQEDSFTDKYYIQQADDFDGDSLLSFGPRLNFFVLENFTALVELADDQELEGFRDFCFEIASTGDVFGPPPEVMIERLGQEAELSEIAKALEEIERRLLQDNDLSRSLSKERDALVFEVKALREFIAQPRFRAAAAISMAKNTLGWISAQAGSAVIGAAALAALAAISSLF